MSMENANMPTKKPISRAASGATAARRWCEVVMRNNIVSVPSLLFHHYYKIRLEHTLGHEHIRHPVHRCGGYSNLHRDGAARGSIQSIRDRVSTGIGNRDRNGTDARGIELCGIETVVLHDVVDITRDVAVSEQMKNSRAAALARSAGEDLAHLDAATQLEHA